MTEDKSLKKLVRDVQERTHWNYAFCRRLVTVLGYERVSQAIDDAPADAAPGAVGDALNAEASAKERASKEEKRDADD